jgi:hypothetical protein
MLTFFRMVETFPVYCDVGFKEYYEDEEWQEGAKKWMGCKTHSRTDVAEPLPPGPSPPAQPTQYLRWSVTDLEEIDWKTIAEVPITVNKAKETPFRYAKLQIIDAVPHEL